MKQNGAQRFYGKHGADEPLAFLGPWQHVLLRTNLLGENNLDMQVTIESTRTLSNKKRRSYKADCILLQLQLPTSFQNSAEKRS